MLVPERMQGETRVAISQVAEDERVARCTVNAWCHQGAYGNILESFMVGGIRYTTKEALQRFIEG